MKTVLAVSHLQIGEGTLRPDGKISQEIFDIDTRGLGSAWTPALCVMSRCSRRCGAGACLSGC